MRIRTVSALLTLLASLSLWPAGPAVADTAADGRVAYENSAQGDTDIHVVNADGTGDVNVTPGTPTSQELDPAWSPDGARIAFISDRVTDTNPDGNLELFVMNADGTDVMQLTVTEAALGGFVQTYAPTWSPDGGTIAFSGYRQWGSSEIFTIPSAGGAEIKLTDPGDWANKWEPDWSSDGSTIVFTWGWDAYSQELRDMAPDGTAVRTLFDGDPRTAQRNPSFSPDVTRIAFLSYHEDANG
ncbi:MAG: PD40 domain-containing protein, partial [Actinobacteria bacterium]|nr:PD40 domain-containing protein [Actinomycetota bacterium]